MFHTPVTADQTVVTVSNLGASPVTVTVALPLRVSRDSSGVQTIYTPQGWEESAWTATTWAWSTTLQPGESRGLRTGWYAGSAGSREVIVSVGADEVQTLDIEPPFVVAGRRSSAPELDGGADEVVMAPNLR